MSDEIPQWALERAAELANKEGGEVGAASDAYTPDGVACTYIGRTFARYIAQHEELPVDPLLSEAREIVARHADSLGFDEDAKSTRAGDIDSLESVQFTLTGLRRGIELGKAGAA